MPQNTNATSRETQFIPTFDSSSSMLFSLGNYLSGSEEGVGSPTRLPKMIGDLMNITPEALRESIYRLSGLSESLSLRRLRRVSEEYISRWITGSYPEKKCPAVAIGSSNGALIHVCAALGIPWIPQTILLAVARKMDPDELIRDAEWGKKAAEIIRGKISYMRVYQMHDPIQDRIMVANMGYFRVKRLKLGPYLEDYIRRALVPGGTLFISDCSFKWPAAQMSRDHYFQTGGLGDVDGGEYAEGSRRIEKFLKDQNAERKKWDIPRPLRDVPEAEWGYDPELTKDIRKFARKNGFRVKRIRFDNPRDLSPLAADLSRYWYKNNGITDKRLLVECFAMIEPYWAARTGSVPFWMAFNTSRSLEAVESYMNSAGRYDDIYLMLMSNAVEGVGCIPIRRWKSLLKRAKKSGAFIGVDEKKFPHDLGSFIKYHEDLQKKIKPRHFMPRPMPLEEFFGFMNKNGKRYRVRLDPKP